MLIVMVDKIRIYVDMDNVLCDYKKAYNEVKGRDPEIKYPQSEYGFFLNLEPIHLSLLTFTYLSKFFDVWILSSPSVMNPMSYTEKRVWVENHLGIEAAKKLILSPNKSLLIGDYLIDDYDNHPTSLQQEFKGKLIHFGSKEFPDWFTVYNYFKNLRGKKRSCVKLDRKAKIGDILYVFKG
jgi:5'-nucleotidase